MIPQKFLDNILIVFIPKFGVLILPKICTWKFWKYACSYFPSYKIGTKSLDLWRALSSYDYPSLSIFFTPKSTKSYFKIFYYLLRINLEIIFKHLDWNKSAWPLNNFVYFNLIKRPKLVIIIHIYPYPSHENQPNYTSKFFIIFYK